MPTGIWVLGQTAAICIQRGEAHIIPLPKSTLPSVKPACCTGCHNAASLGAHPQLVFRLQRRLTRKPNHQPSFVSRNSEVQVSPKLAAKTPSSDLRPCSTRRSRKRPPGLASAPISQAGFFGKTLSKYTASYVYVYGLVAAQQHRAEPLPQLRFFGVSEDARRWRPLQSALAVSHSKRIVATLFARCMP